MDDRTTNVLVLFALFRPGTRLDAVLAELRAQGVPDHATDIVSPLPLSGLVHDVSAQTPLYLITILAGVIGIGVGLFFAVGTAVMYPLMTGGKPIVSWPIVGIISYETMMLLAIVVTFFIVVRRIRRGHRRGVGHDSRIDDGMVGLSIVLADVATRPSSLHALLEEAGAEEIILKDERV